LVTQHADEAADACLLDLLRRLEGQGYRFLTPTPETHRRVIARRPDAIAADVRDVFGWSLPFEAEMLDPALFDLLERAGMAQREGQLWRSLVRVSSCDDRLFLHSAFPTEARDSVFLGPDSYRFVRFVRGALCDARPVRRLVDIGAGAGIGAIMAAACLDGARIALTDVNPRALRFARINADLAGVEVEILTGSGLEPVEGPFDLAITNPPFIADAGARAYRDGGDMHGARLSLDWTLAAAARLAPGGRVLLYTGSAIVDGEDCLRASLLRALGPLGCTLRYAELDPDIFGEQLAEPGYEDVERIAAVGAVIDKG
jgi:hypothetical protein